MIRIKAKTDFQVAFVISIIGLASTIFVSAQDKEIKLDDLLGYLATSRATTNNGPYRSRVTVEISDDTSGPWRSYSSWVDEVVPPDRSHFTYTSGRKGDFIKIGKAAYSRQPNGDWVVTSVVSISIPNIPMARPGFAPSTTFTESLGDDGVLTVTAITKNKGNAKNLFIYTYSFDEHGVLIAKSNTGFNGSNWVKQTNRLEHDSSIRIVAPIE